MSTWTDLRDRFLEAGVDGLLGGNGAAQQPPPEQVVQDEVGTSTRDNANPPSNFLMSVTSEQILVTTALIVAGIAVVHFVRN